MKHFTISELIKSDTAVKHGLWNGANREAEENLRCLVEQVLDPLREAYGRPVHVTSGYRCPQLNRLVGGSPNSQHMRGEAADIVAKTQQSTSPQENLKLGRLIEQLGRFDQLIYEQCDPHGNPRWIHVSWRRNGNNRKKVITT